MIRIPDSKIEKAAAKGGEVRTYLTAPYFTGEGIVATDGHILAYVPVIHDQGDEQDAPGHIPLDAFKQARKAKLPELHFPNGDCMAAGVKFPLADLGRYPDWQQITKAPLAVANREPLGEVVSIALDTKLLFELAQALSTNPKQPIVRLIIDHNDKDYQKAAIHVEAAATDAGAYGLIMPCNFRGD